MKLNTLVTKYTDALTSNFTHTINPKWDHNATLTVVSEIRISRKCKQQMARCFNITTFTIWRINDIVWCVPRKKVSYIENVVLCELQY